MCVLCAQGNGKQSNEDSVLCAVTLYRKRTSVVGKVIKESM
jgi:hypothetical protein